MIDPVLDHIDATLEDALTRLSDFLRIDSVSTDPAYAASCAKAAQWLVDDLSSIGAQAQTHPTDGHPMVTGTLGDGGKHVLFYGHYDVQPVDPLDLWDHPPFDPRIEDGPNGRIIRGRGASDDKGQLMTFVEACRAWIAVHGSLPAKVTFFFEGEEESGSPSMLPFLDSHGDDLRADIALICDTGMVAPGVPSITTQLRGMLKDEFTLIGPSHDLHSGHYGGTAINPLREMTRIVDSFYNDDRSVAVEGFYEGVHPTPPAQLAQWQECGFDPDHYLGNAGMTQTHGEAGYSILEHQWARPTLEINGLWGGYQGAGSKTVIPSEAHCKITCRLVGDQDPDVLRDRIRAHVEARLGADLRVEWDNDLEGSPASVMDITNPDFETARQALTQEWGREAVFNGAGGSIPIAGFFQQKLGMEAMLVGFANEDDRIHSPNEKYNVESFHKGIRSWVRILAALAQ